MLLNNYAKGANKARAVIFSVSGTTLTDHERGLFRECDPLGFILFARNIEEPDQLRRLCDALKETVGRDCPILIDQEGGRVARLKPPLWSGHPAAQTFGAIYSHDEARARDDLTMRTKGIAKDLRAAGINVNCDPVMDVLCSETHDVIGDRAYGDDPSVVSDLGLAVCRDYLQSGITPIIKHIPGHGRACADSHLELPVVEASLSDMQALDFVPFKHVAQSDIGDKVWAMSAHILYKALDPDLPLTLSAGSIADIVRGDIGFNGILISDDVSMLALEAYGGLAERCVASLRAGCDIALYCAGKFDEMEAIAQDIPALSSATLRRLEKAAS